MLNYQVVVPRFHDAVGITLERNKGSNDKA